jgi:hypothetical protein
MERTEILRLLCEGRSPDAIAGDGAANLEEVLALKVSGGRASLWYQDKTLRKLETRHIHLSARKVFDFPNGGLWSWLALDAENKLVISWALGARNGGIAALFLDEVFSRLPHPAKVTTEDAADEIVEWAVRPDYRLLDAVFGPVEASGLIESRNRLLHDDVLEHSKPRREAAEDYAHGLALSALYWNFVCEREDGTPAMAAGIVDTPWSFQHVAELIDMWTSLKTGPWYERVVVLGESPFGE